MIIDTDVKYIVRDPAVLGGVPTIAGHRIAVHHIAWWYRQGQSVEQMTRDYVLTPSQVHAALLYYYDHQIEIDQEIEDIDIAFAEAVERDQSPLNVRMRELMRQRLEDAQ